MDAARPFLVGDPVRFPGGSGWITSMALKRGIARVRDGDDYFTVDIGNLRHGS